MTEPFATLQDLKAHWPALPPGDEALAVQKLDEAAVEIRGNYPTIEIRIAAGTLPGANPRLVSVRMVKRAMEAKQLPGVDRATSQTGPFMSTLHFTNADGALYLTKADRRLLQSRRTHFSVTTTDKEHTE